MPNTLPAGMLDHDFLKIRSRLIDLAAALDRIDRSEDGADDDPRRGQICRSLEILRGSDSNRAEQVQLVFSLPYEDTRPQRP